MDSLDPQRLRIASDLLKESGFNEEAEFLLREAAAISGRVSLAKMLDEMAHFYRDLHIKPLFVELDEKSKPKVAFPLLYSSQFLDDIRYSLMRPPSYKIVWDEGEKGSDPSV